MLVVAVDMPVAVADTLAVGVVAAVRTLAAVVDTRALPAAPAASLVARLTRTSRRVLAGLVLITAPFITRLRGTTFTAGTQVVVTL